MKAIILVGGYGTRLRPLTFTCAKPLVPFCNKPIMRHQIEALASVGVKEVILAVSYRPDSMRAFIDRVGKDLGVKVTISLEDEPLGTAGPLALARKLLEADGGEPFFMLNSDVICEFPFKSMLSFHRAHGGEGTIFVTPVEDPSKFGVVLYDDKGKISSFVEKPKEFIGDRINAGLYLFNCSILDRVPARPCSIEREIFPAIAADNKLFALELQGYWRDVGQPKDYIAGTVLHLASLAEHSPKELGRDGVQCEGNVMIHPTAKIGAGARIGPDVVIGAGAVVGDGARLRRCVLLEGASVMPHASVASSIVGWKSRVGSWANLDRCVLGEDVGVANTVVMRDATVCPYKGVKEDILSAKIVL